jgi:SCO1/SenC
VLLPRIAASVAADFGRGDYVLTATDGTTFTDDTLVGSPSQVFFGFTHCLKVCPTTSSDIAEWQEQLGDAGPLRVYFVTVDSERGTAALLGDCSSQSAIRRIITGNRQSCAVCSAKWNRKYCRTARPVSTRPHLMYRPGLGLGIRRFSKKALPGQV